MNRDSASLQHRTLPLLHRGSGLGYNDASRLAILGDSHICHFQRFDMKS